VSDQRIVKWTRWIKTTIQSNVMTMYLQRDAYRTVSEMLAANADNLPESYWWEFMRDTYGTTQAIAVRRQADTGRGVASLGKLIEEISDDAGRLTREFTLDEVHEAVDVIGKLFERYYNLLTASFFTELVPVIQHDWMAAFRVPWMPPGYSPPKRERAEGAL
jgi:hypothetical protein